MNKSRLVDEDKIYVKFDDSGKTQLVKAGNIQPGFCYRRVRNTLTGNSITGVLMNNDKFIDQSFPINENQLSRLSNSNQRIVLRRLTDLLRISPRNPAPQFFPTRNTVPARRLSSDPFLPPFATEIGLFPAQYYKSFFLTQDFSVNGRYEMIINDKGRFQIDVVDDWVPVYEKSMEHIWGLDVDQAWQIILLKFWAKRCHGYENVKNMPPFFFIQCFSNSNWKYHNLQRDGLQFLAHYTGRTNMGKFVLKTKSNNLVKQAGLIPQSAGYELINLQQLTKSNTVNTNNNINHTSTHDNLTNRKWVGTVRSTLTNKWSGSMSVLDKQLNTRYFPDKQKLSLDRDFMINETDFINLFSTAYVASRRDEQESHYISDYYLLTVEPQNKKAIYLKFTIQKDGWLDFCVRQADNTRVSPTDKSKFKSDQENQRFGYNDGKRFLSCKFILMKVNDANSPTTYPEANYLPPSYDTYDIEYYHGYNRGDARFLNVVRGTYILRIKPEKYQNTSYYVVNYASNMPITMTEIFPDKKQTSIMMRQAMGSLIGPMANEHKDVDRKFQQIVFANSFENIGYGFVGVRLNKSCPYSILIEVDPKQVNNAGYKLKNQFKTINEPFSVTVNPGETTTIVMKKIPGAQHSWPPKGIATFKTK